MDNRILEKYDWVVDRIYSDKSGPDCDIPEDVAVAYAKLMLGRERGIILSREDDAVYVLRNASGVVESDGLPSVECYRLSPSDDDGFKTLGYRRYDDEANDMVSEAISDIFDNGDSVRIRDFDDPPKAFNEEAWGWIKSLCSLFGEVPIPAYFKASPSGQMSDSDVLGLWQWFMEGDGECTYT